MYISSKPTWTRMANGSAKTVQIIVPFICNSTSILLSSTYNYIFRNCLKIKRTTLTNFTIYRATLLLAITPSQSWNKDKRMHVTPGTAKGPVYKFLLFVQTLFSVFPLDVTLDSATVCWVFVRLVTMHFLLVSFSVSVRWFHCVKQLMWRVSFTSSLIKQLHSITRAA